MAPRRATRASFDREAFCEGLRLLSRLISTSPVLRPYLPLELIATGGFVSVMRLQNRAASEDLDYFVSETQLGGSHPAVRGELQDFIHQVADTLAYDAHWANDDVRAFLTLLDDPERLFVRSKEQGVVLWQDGNLVIYAALWEWSLVRKLKRIGMQNQTPRNQDWNDCVAICDLLYRNSGAAFDLNLFRQFDDTDREPPVTEEVLVSLGRLMRRFKSINLFRDRRMNQLVTAAAGAQNATQSGSTRSYWAWSGRARRWAFIVEGQGAVPEREWPSRSGRHQVYCTDSNTWKWFDFDRNAFE